MPVVIPGVESALPEIATAKSYPYSGGVYSHQRSPSDPLFYADIEAQNIIVGSRWMLGYDNAGTFTELDSGTAVATSFTISNVPSYASPFLLELRVRKSSAATKYEPFKTFSYHSPNGVTVYVSQVVDGVAN